MGKTTLVKQILADTQLKSEYFIMYDAALLFGKFAGKESGILAKLNQKDYYLATVHRQENTDDPGRLSSILNAFNVIADKNCPVIFPIHPRTEKMIRHYRRIHYQCIAKDQAG